MIPIPPWKRKTTACLDIPSSMVFVNRRNSQLPSKPQSLRLVLRAEADTSTCPPSGTLGIRYGRCYTLSDLGGDPITRYDTTWPYYYFGRVNSLREIVFRVCHNVTEASCSSPLDEYVLDSGKWFLQDKTGFGADGNAKFVGTVAGSGGYYISLTDSDTTTGAGQVVDFEAKIRCLFGKCIPCVRLHVKTGSAPKEYLGLTNSLWTTYGGDALITTPKNTTCYPIVFQETACSFP